LIGERVVNRQNQNKTMAQPRTVFCLSNNKESTQ